MAQKISFLKQESSVRNPTEEEILSYYKENKEDYFVESTYTFSHIYFSKDDQAESRSIKALELIEEGQESNIFGDPFLLGKNFSSKTIRELQRSFGDQFSQSIQNLSVKKWSGPISSEYGEHLIFLNSYTESYLPDRLVHVHDRAVWRGGRRRHDWRRLAAVAANSWVQLARPRGGTPAGGHDHAPQIYNGSYSAHSHPPAQTPRFTRLAASQRPRSEC